MKKLPIERSFAVGKRLLFFLFLLWAGCVADLLKQFRDSTVAPLYSSKNHVFRINVRHAWPQTPGFFATSLTQHFSNTSKDTIEFFQSLKSTPSNITSRNHEVYHNSPRSNHTNSPHNTWRDTFTSLFRISLIPQTENFHNFRLKNRNNRHNFTKFDSSTYLENKIPSLCQINSQCLLPSCNILNTKLLFSINGSENRLPCIFINTSLTTLLKLFLIPPNFNSFALSFSASIRP